MSVNYYWAIVDKIRNRYRAHVPDLYKGAAPAWGDSPEEALLNAAEEAAKHIRHIQNTPGRPIPQPMPFDKVQPKIDPGTTPFAKSLVPVRVPDKPVEVTRSRYKVIRRTTETERWAGEGVGRGRAPRRKPTGRKDTK